jgi:hypothetical protein
MEPEKTKPVSEAEVRSYFLGRHKAQKKEALDERETTVERIRGQAKGREIVFENRRAAC